MVPARLNNPAFATLFPRLSVKAFDPNISRVVAKHENLHQVPHSEARDGFQSEAALNGKAICRVQGVCCCPHEAPVPGARGVIHYHGLPMTPAADMVKAFSGRHGMVSFEHPDQIENAVEVCQSIVLDNGAFSAWKAGRP